MMMNPRFLLVTYPAQGHINPSLQFAKRLIRIGALVTVAITVSVRRRMSNKTSFPDGLSFAAFSDGYDDGLKSGDDTKRYMSELRSRGSRAIADLIQGAADDGRPFTCLVYTMLLPWAAQVARAHSLPVAFLWIQPATVLDIYYYYFNGYADVFRRHGNDASCLIELPGLPPLTGRDLPSFFHPENPYTTFLSMFEEELEKLNQEVNHKVLVNTFDALEPKALRSISDKFNMIGIGPLIPSAFLDVDDPSDTTFGTDLFHGGEDHIEWLNSKPISSVVYLSFGTISVLSKPQMEAIARGLLACGRPFFWVTRAEQNEPGDTEKHNLISCREELERQGKIVSWCSQLQLLSHPSIGCFMTHCGWNSTAESLASGIPVVAFPQWADQWTNAKLIDDVWKTGVRVMRNEEGIVEEEEIKRCLDLVMGSGELADQIKRNAQKWKDLARDAVKAGGSSDKNLKAFADEFGDRS